MSNYKMPISEQIWYMVEGAAIQATFTWAMALVFIVAICL